MLLHRLKYNFLPLLIIAVAFLSSHQILAATSSLSSPSTCQPLNSDFDFIKRPPTSQRDLAFCTEYAASTCCEKSHTLNVLRSLTPLFSADIVSERFSDSCKQLTSRIACAPCQPDIGTRQKVGVCPNMCSEWYDACADALYTEVDSLLRPCTDASLVCAPLSSIVRDGREFCERTGVGAGELHATHKSIQDEIHALIQRDESVQDPTADIIDDSDTITCFDGRQSSSSSSYSDPSASHKRYYKSASELEEIERLRQKRREEQATRDYNKQVWVQLSREILAIFTSLIQSVQRRWSRMLRMLPIPYSIRSHLDSPLILSVVLLFAAQLFLRLLLRTCTRFCRTRRVVDGATSNLSSSGLSPEDIRLLRAQKLMEQKYAEGSKPGTFFSTTDKLNASTAAPKTYTTVIDGEVVTLPE